MRFSYKARAQDGSIQSGVVEASSLESAIKSLQENRLIIISVKPKREGKIWQIQIAARVKPKDLVNFTRQLSVMFTAKVPLVEALSALAVQTESVLLRKTLNLMAKDVEAGLPLSRALAKHKKIFNDFYVSMVKSGEVAGKLEEIFNYLADYIEREYELGAKAKSAMIYPAFVFGGLILAAVVMLVFVVPQITAVLEESGQSLPFITLALIRASEFVRTFWYLLLIIFLGLGGGVWYYYSKTAGGRIGWDKLKLHLPVFGGIFQKIYLGRFAESLSTLLIGGIPITQALDTTSDIVGNHVYKSVLSEVVDVVKKGQLINVVFRRYPRVIPPLVTQMVAVGESTGQLDLVLKNVGEFYRKEVARTMDNLVSLIEPLLILILGVGVATLIIAILVPMYNLASSF